jgi:RHS repeat-associated protein
MIWSCVNRAFFIACLQWTDLTSKRGYFRGQGHDYLTIGEELLGIHVTQPSVNANGPCASSTATMCNRFFIRDHLGSVAVVTDDGGNVLERDLYDPWGKRRNANGSPDINNTVTSKTTRGFTGQEMVQNGSGFELVSLNARLYDPTIGRFLSTDPQLPKAGAQADLINPYSYCDNNPLSITDPTGQSFLGILGAIVGIIIAVVLIYTGVGAGLAGLLETGTYGAADAYPVATAAIVGGISGAADSAIASGGNLDATLEGLGIGAATGAAFGAVGHFTDIAQGAKSSLFEDAVFGGAHGTEASIANDLAQVAGDGLVGGLSSVAEGGNFGSGFLASGFSNAFGYSLLGQYVMTGGGSLNAYNVAVEAVVGGVGSVLGGGSFEDGVMTGSFRYLFNECAAGPTACGQAIGRSVDAFLHTITLAEWGAYDRLFGGGTFSDYSTHPPGVMINGTYYSAAGAYQITLGSWKYYGNMLGLTDFSPQTQDSIAIEMLTQDRVMPLLSAGNIGGAASLASGTWSSLPGGSQQRVDTTQFVSHYNSLLQGGQ